MRPFPFTVRVAVAASLLSALPLAAEDLTIVSKVVFGNNESTSTQYISSDYSKSSTPDVDSIVHFPTGKLTTIDKKKKEYWETTIEEMEEFWDGMSREMRRSGAADMFGLRDEPELEKLKGSRKIAGYDCERWSLQIGDVLEVDFWAAPGLVPPARYYDGRRLSVASMGPMGQLFEKMYAEFKKVKGMPLSSAVIIRTPMSRTSTEDEAQEVKKGPIPASTFEVPSGYKKVDSPFKKR
jgi:hypothetical protein